MNLYIETENGQTKNHPAFEENLLQAFGAIPENWEPFVRVSRPTFGIYQILEFDEPIYTKVNGVWTDVWFVRDMTLEEKTTKQQSVRTAFNAREPASNWSTWILDEATCEMIPPISRPDAIEGVLVFWCGAENNWKIAPNYPMDDKKYKFDFLVWQWNEVTQG
jgi:hypothetical protein